MGVVTDVVRSRRISTRDPPLTVVPSPTDPLLVLPTDGTVQALNPSLPPCHLRLTTEPRHSFAFAIEITPPLLIRGVRYLPFLGFQSILCSATGRRSLHSARTVSKSRLRNAQTNGRPRGKLHKCTESGRGPPVILRIDVRMIQVNIIVCLLLVPVKLLVPQAKGIAGYWSHRLRVLQVTGPTD